jgi:hypothetical protein
MGIIGRDVDAPEPGFEGFTQLGMRVEGANLPLDEGLDPWLETHDDTFHGTRSSAGGAL